MRLRAQGSPRKVTPSPAFHPNGTMYIAFHCDDAMGDGPLDVVRAACREATERLSEQPAPLTAHR